MGDRYPVERLRGLVQDVLLHHDVLPEHAAVAAARMLDADLRGVATHGVAWLPAYVERIAAGGYNLRPSIQVVSEYGSVALVDGDNALGQVVMTEAARIAGDRAEQHGLAWVGVRGSNHAGAGGVYAAMALERGMIGLYGAIGRANVMPPWGGTDLLLGTNPLAVAVPAGEEPPVVLDMATTVASNAKVKRAVARGEEIPEGWLIDRAGRSVTDPARAAEAFLAPIGGPKGYGLNVVLGLLAGTLNGAAFGSEVVDANADLTTPTNSGHTIVMLNPDALRPREEFLAAVDERIRELRDATPMEGVGPVRLPGDRAARAREEGLRDGIALDDHVVRRLGALAEDAGVAHPF